MNTLLELTLMHAQKMGRALIRPNENIIPHVIIATPENVKFVVLSNFHTAEQKRTFFEETLPALICDTQATEIVYVGIAWIMHVPIQHHVINTMKLSAIENMPAVISQREMLIVTHADAQRTQSYTAGIVRSSNYPPLVDTLAARTIACDFLLEPAMAALASVEGTKN